MNYFDRFKAKFPAWQQDPLEIGVVTNLIRENTRTYLEIGTAEGGSIYYFGHCLPLKTAVCVDYDEDHTREVRQWAFDELEAIGKDCEKMKPKVSPSLLSGDSKDPVIIDAVKNIYPDGCDVVFIDGGHDYQTVLSDWKNYGPMANKFCIFHDICLNEVKRVWDSIPAPKLNIIETGKYGMGIVFMNNARGKQGD